MERPSLRINSESIRGNLRTYRRRDLVRPQRPPAAEIIDDVKEAEVLTAQNTGVSVQKPVLGSPVLNTMPSTTQPGMEVVYVSPVSTRVDSQAEPISAETPEPTELPVAVQQEVQQVATVEIEDTTIEDYEAMLVVDQPAPEPVSEYSYHEDEFLKSQLTKIDYDEPLIKQKGKFRFLHPRYLLPSMALLLFLIGCGVALQGFRANREVQAAADNHSNQSQNNSEEVADESEPDSKAFGSYKVAPDMPRYIRIAKAGVNNRVVKVGVKSDNELRAPNNIFDVGWYENSSKPGQPGAALMDAHVHGPTKPGAFYNLKLLNVGDEIEVERGDGSKLKYKVAATESVPYQQVDMAKMMRPYTNGKQGLNLITCGGAYNKTTKTYEQRTLVYAVQL